MSTDESARSPLQLARRVVPAALLCVIASATVRPQSAPLEDLGKFPQTTLEIKSDTAIHRFSVWVADTPTRQEQGLMFVRDLPADRAMLFVHCCSGIWMKNTYIELDVVFVGADGRILKIAPRARPFDETTISPGGVAEEVVELKGGTAAALGIRQGDRVSWHTPYAPGS